MAIQSFSLWGDTHDMRKEVSLLGDACVVEYVEHTCRLMASTEVIKMHACFTVTAGKFINSEQDRQNP